MISLIIAVLMSLILLGLAHWTKTHPIPKLGKLLRRALCVIAALSLVTGIALYPLSQSWQEHRAAESRALTLATETSRAQEMIAILGSPQAYIEYLKVTQPH